MSRPHDRRPPGRPAMTGPVAAGVLVVAASLVGLLLVDRWMRELDDMPPLYAVPGGGW